MKIRAASVSAVFAQDSRLHSLTLAAPIIL
jgi:hypothetical protein